MSYTYDETGMRTSKTYEGVTRYYTYKDTKLVGQYELDSNGNAKNKVEYLYDSNDEAVAFVYNGKMGCTKILWLFVFKSYK